MWEVKWLILTKYYVLVGSSVVCNRHSSGVCFLLFEQKRSVKHWQRQFLFSEHFYYFTPHLPLQHLVLSAAALVGTSKHDNFPNQSSLAKGQPTAKTTVLVGSLLHGRQLAKVGRGDLQISLPTWILLHFYGWIFPAEHLHQSGQIQQQQSRHLQTLLVPENVRALSKLDDPNGAAGSSI